LFPTDDSLESLLWPKKETLNAIGVLKKYKLSVFREDMYSKKIVKLFGWNSDGWIGKNVMARVTSGEEGILSMNVYLPTEIFSKVYKNSLILQIIIDGKIIDEQKFSNGSFDKGAVDITLNVPKNETLSLELKLDKFYIPAEFDLGKDLRELGIIINKIEAK
ncbi:MAG: hypothetical protein NTY75_04175, partial [Candidatus Shapirobacteria bacterium]|nr:hypothetical protein [Candidatus Shapirobacteria bacterium]